MAAPYPPAWCCQGPRPSSPQTPGPGLPRGRIVQDARAPSGHNSAQERHGWRTHSVLCHYEGCRVEKLYVDLLEVSLRLAAGAESTSKTAYRYGGVQQRRVSLTLSDPAEGVRTADSSRAFRTGTELIRTKLTVNRGLASKRDRIADHQLDRRLVRRPAS